MYRSQQPIYKVVEYLDMQCISKQKAHQQDLRNDNEIWKVSVNISRANRHKQDANYKLTSQNGVSVAYGRNFHFRDEILRESQPPAPYQTSSIRQNPFEVPNDF